ncbi:MAG TPA: ATP-binding protein [Candidatus Acidoferrales bacterium]|nr:ATP-binding protein [Candidatus Acidoferrales bacterium]
MRPRLLIRALRYALVLGVLFLIAYVYRRILPVNQTTVALTFLLAILTVSTVWGLRISVFMSLAAMLVYDYYFLPPVGSFAVASPENWVALVAFLGTALVASQLATRVRREADTAQRQRREIERLYAFSQQLLVEGNVIQLLNAIPNHIVDIFEVGAAALYLINKQKFYRSGSGQAHLDEEAMKNAANREEPSIDYERMISYVPVRIGVQPLGSLGISGPILTRKTLEALGTLVAIAAERARAVERLGKAEAAREGEQLRSALLDSITHDLRTPLTSIKASVTSLLSETKSEDLHKRELLTIINEEADRLNQLVGDAAEMARLDAGEFELKLEPHSIQEIVGAAIEQAKPFLGNRPVRLELDGVLPPVRADLDRIRDVLVRLIENANAYSPPGTPVTISAEQSDSTLVTSVADQGPGIEEMEIGLIFDRFYRGKDQRFQVQGTGMGLPIAKAIVEAHGGTIGVTSQLGHGSVFYFSLPLDHSAALPR